ncbi:MAG: flagellin [Proteobacteria bacterium]|nr:flagellin [Pseudomonadota bacterium]
MLRVANLAQHTFFLNNVLNLQSRTFEQQAQIATGKKALNYSGIARDAKRLITLEGSKSQTAQFVENNQRVIARAERMDAAVSGIFDAASELRTTLIQRLNDAGGDMVNLSLIAQNLLDSVGSLLNSDEDGRFLFSGSMTDTPPVQFPVPDPASFGVLDNNYYQGDNIQLTVRADVNLTVTYGMGADRIGFQRIIGALKAAVEGHATNDKGLIESALSLVNTAIADLADYRNELGNTLLTLDDTNSRHRDFVVYLDNQISNIEDVDITEAIIRLTENQTILEASFLTVSRLSNLNLSDFLR